MTALASTFLVLAVVFGGLAIFMIGFVWFILYSGNDKVWGFEIIKRDPYDLRNWLQPIGLFSISMALILLSALILAMG